MTLIGSSADARAGRSSVAEWEWLDDQIAAANGGTRMTVRRSYDKLLPRNWTASSAGVNVGNRISCWSVKLQQTVNGVTSGYTWAQVANGNANNALDAFFATIPVGHEAYLTYFHEPENNSGDPDDWRNAWVEFARRVWATGRSNLHASFNLMSHTWRANDRNPNDWNVAPLLSTAEKNATVATVDGYGTPANNTPASVFDPCFTSFANWGFSRFGIMETAQKLGLQAPGNDQSRWADLQGLYIQSRGDLEVVCWWHALLDNNDYHLDTQAEIRAWATVVGGGSTPRDPGDPGDPPPPPGPPPHPPPRDDPSPPTTVEGLVRIMDSVSGYAYERAAFASNGDWGAVVYTYDHESDPWATTPRLAVIGNNNGVPTLADTIDLPVAVATGEDTWNSESPLMALGVSGGFAVLTQRGAEEYTPYLSLVTVDGSGQATVEDTVTLDPIYEDNNDADYQYRLFALTPTKFVLGRWSYVYGGTYKDDLSLTVVTVGASSLTVDTTWVTITLVDGTYYWGEGSYVPLSDSTFLVYASNSWEPSEAYLVSVSGTTITTSAVTNTNLYLTEDTEGCRAPTSGNGYHQWINLAEDDVDYLGELTVSAGELQAVASGSIEAVSPWWRTDVGSAGTSALVVWGGAPFLSIMADNPCPGGYNLVMIHGYPASGGTIWWHQYDGYYCEAQLAVVDGALFGFGMDAGGDLNGWTRWVFPINPSDTSRFIPFGLPPCAEEINENLNGAALMERGQFWRPRETW